METTYQLLVSTMNQSDCSIVDKMNIRSDAIIINQCSAVSKEVLIKEGFIVQFYSFDERGIGLSRNSAFMRASADIIEFADDDMVFSSTYKQDVVEEFRRHPEADAILFSVESMNPERPLLTIKKFSRVRRREALKYGCARLAVRREKLLYNNISFSLLFGGGAKFGSGEDTIILQNMLRAKMRIYKSPIMIANIEQKNSTWFNGYTEKYYLDKGALFAASMPYLCYFYAAISSLKSNNKEFGRSKVFSLYCRGIRDYNRVRKGKMCQ